MGFLYKTLSGGYFWNNFIVISIIIIIIITLLLLNVFPIDKVTHKVSRFADECLQLNKKSLIIATLYITLKIAKKKNVFNSKVIPENLKYTKYAQLPLTAK